MPTLNTKRSVSIPEFVWYRAIAAVCIAILNLIAGCTLIPVEQDYRLVVVEGTLGNDVPQIKSELYAQYTVWKEVEFKHGGLSKDGVDCSGFVYLTFLEKFGVTLPRSTALQADTGVEILQRDLRAGDLVFFKTGIFNRHVGIYLENRTFMHVSKKKGVSISSMDSTYWKKRYWQARRM